MKALRGKAALVTGGGRGIGRATALKLADEGCDVAVCSRTKSEVDVAAKEIRAAYGVKSVGLGCDVRIQEDVRRAVARTLDEFGRIDILVNNAGTLVYKPAIETSEKEWDDVIDTNLKGPFLFSKEVIPHMARQRSGTIVNVSSGAGRTGFADLSAYCASKFGLLGFTQSLAKEAGKFGIKVYAVCPGSVATRMQESYVGKAKYSLLKAAMIRPEKIAQKVYELATSPPIEPGDCLEVYR